MRLTPLQRYRLRRAGLSALGLAVISARFGAVALLGLCALALAIGLAAFVLVFGALVAGLILVFPASKKEAQG